MKPAEHLRGAFLEIRSHKTRSALSCLSLAIGVAAMLFTASQIQSMGERFRKASTLAGPGRIVIDKKHGYVSRGLSPGLTWRDAEEIRRAFPELPMVYALVHRYGTRFSAAGWRSRDVMVKATDPDWRVRDWVYTLRGRFLNARDAAAAARVCVIIQPGGWRQKPFWAIYEPELPIEKVLKRHDLLGRWVQLEDHLFKVVGILVEPLKDQDPRWFRMEWGGGEGTVLVPSTTYRQTLVQSWSGTPDSVDTVQVDTGDAGTAIAYKRRIEGLLKGLHRGEVDFTARDYRELIEGALKRIKQYALAVLVIGVVAVLAGGIGIMNVTLATIFSRIREIGIRRALGATRADIVCQFLVEAMALGLVGGAAGTGLGAAAIVYLAPRAERMASLSPVHVLGALVVAVGTGFVFALYPAYQASRLDPIEALHYE